jgi:hypothetical protein
MYFIVPNGHRAIIRGSIDRASCYLCFAAVMPCSGGSTPPNTILSMKFLDHPKSRLTFLIESNVDE